MRLIVTAEEVSNRGKWQEFCTLRGIDEYAISEGQIDRTDEFVLTHEEAWSLGFITVPPRRDRSSFT